MEGPTFLYESEASVKKFGLNFIPSDLNVML
jgi:hypothetical protein